MAQDPMAKIPLFAGQFAWAISKKSGSYFVIFGPDPMDATDDELFVISSEDVPTKVVPVEHPREAIQDFVTIKPGEYAVIHNPAENFTTDHPNGPYAKGRNDVKALEHGTKRVVTKGYFPTWPGQEVEVRKIHTLSSNQYLMAVVESEDIDTNAPYYDLTLKCASIKKAVINESIIIQIQIFHITDLHVSAMGTNDRMCFFLGGINAICLVTVKCIQRSSDFGNKRGHRMISSILNGSKQSILSTFICVLTNGCDFIDHG